MRRPELLIPASSLEVLKTAVIYGADAVYIGKQAASGIGNTHCAMDKCLDLKIIRDMFPDLFDLCDR